MDQGHATTEGSTDRGACARSGGRPRAPLPASFAELKQQQLVFTLVRQLAEAMFVRADRELSRRLWQEVAVLEIDPDRITALLYGGQSCDDREGLMALDASWTEQVHPAAEPRRGFRWGWGGGAPRRGVISSRPSAGGRRSAPPATPPARRGAG
ncbi:hypothetical protein I1E95_09615 [Synechococcus sp. CBW1107]|uniref:hypothetical protein n=1 Tax=Synechococcus sp. CBW1107 TaxID=2789857 RepID=UPI0018CCBEAD|nr:hypothetical protein [Synechococcus sp. CBW1107]QPN55477.1 hypothetical protein I1E95_09615 [Synechococcus sp. CBW1107]